MKKKNRHIVQGLLAFLYMFGSFLPSQAAAKDKTVENKAPIVIEADNLYFSDSTGEILAKGHAVVTKAQDKIVAEEIRGNSKESKIWIEKTADFYQSTMKLTGSDIVYNYGNRTGTMSTASGVVDKKLVKGQDIQLDAEHTIIHQGWMTGCPAKVPDYHITADKIEIWPGEQMIAYNASFYIKGKRIFTLPKYKIKLNKNAQTSVFPSIGYTSEDGFLITQHLDYPLTKDTSLFADLTYYSKRGFEPGYGIVASKSNYDIQLARTSERNADDERIIKEPEFMIKTKSIPLGSSPLSAQALLTVGKWKEESASGWISDWRQSYGINITHAPIKLSPRMKLDLSAGYQGIHYNYDDTKNDIFRYKVKLSGSQNRLDWWTSYTYSHQTAISPYKYDRIDTPRELAGGFFYKVDAKNDLGVSVIYNSGTDKLEDVDYTWRHNLHCWLGELTYRAKRDEVNFKIYTVEW